MKDKIEEGFDKFLEGFLKPGAVEKLLQDIKTCAVTSALTCPKCSLNLEFFRTGELSCSCGYLEPGTEN